MLTRLFVFLSAAVGLVVASTVMTPSDLAARAAPTQKPVVLGEYEALGCFNAPMTFHFLQGNDTTIMTVDECLNRCVTQSTNGFPFNFGGVRNDCNFVLPHGAHVVSASQCDLACPGDPSELCGGTGVTQLYRRIDFITASVVPTFDTWASLGCFSDTPANRTLRSNIISRPDLTLDQCLDGCKAAGFALGGLEFGQEVLCGNALLGDSTLLSDQSVCSDACGGNPTQICGGSNALSVYVNNNETFTSGPAHIPDDFFFWTFIGCGIDNDFNRSIPNLLPLDPKRMTVGTCLDACQAQFFTLCAVQDGDQCWAGHGNNTPGIPTVRDACDLQCTGNASEFCGGPFRNQGYLFLGFVPDP
ncbi:WSC-domain-containing protein [Exidia glandulosa HHB12029]|uniref:WSC-domain-containing protein n=1 Tax=Exidia glandulosa HHB12029 TaxID=1314781 RepID=A0A165NBF7_EXIGL|nr:WSC-domain-containing protein [Exidia glandulosa HHB12029]